MNECENCQALQAEVERLKTLLHTTEASIPSSLVQENYELTENFKACKIMLADERARAKGMQDFLEKIKWAGREQIPCPDGISGCAVYHGKFNTQAMLAKEALEKYGSGK